MIQPESVAKFQGTFLSLEHGSVSVGTSTSMSVHVSCIKVEPVSSERTQYDVANVSGTVQVAAHKNDVNITEGGVLQKTNAQGTSPISSVVHEGQQATRVVSDCLWRRASARKCRQRSEYKMARGRRAGSGAGLLCFASSSARARGPAASAPLSHKRAYPTRVAGSCGQLIATLLRRNPPFLTSTLKHHTPDPQYLSNIHECRVY